MVSQRDAGRGTATQEVQKQTVRTGEGEHLTFLLIAAKVLGDWNTPASRVHATVRQSPPFLAASIPEYPPARRFPGVAGLV